jgi:hypothetical protein
LIDYSQNGQCEEDEGKKDQLYDDRQGEHSQSRTNPIYMKDKETKI